MATPFPVPVTAAQVPTLSLSLSLGFALFFFFFSVFLMVVVVNGYRSGRTLWGTTTRFCSSSRTLCTSSTPMPVPCFVSTETRARPPLQCS
jgi:hypothetical protein